MKTIKFDLTDLEMENEKREQYTEWGDHPARTEMEAALMEYAGKVVIVRITEYRPKRK